MHLFALPLLLLLVDPTPSREPSPSPATSGTSRVEVPAFGVSYEKPAGWFTVSLDIAENLKRSGLSAEEQKAILSKSPGGVPLHSFQKHDPKVTAGFIPTINVIALPNSPGSNERLLAAAKKSLEQNRSSLPEFAYELEPRLIKSDQLDAVEFVIRFVMPTRAGEKIPIRARTLAIPSGSVILQISFNEPTAEKNEAAYSAFERSIVLQVP